MSRPKNDFLTVAEEQTFLAVLSKTGDYDVACRAIPHVDPKVLPKEVAFKRLGLALPKPDPKPDPKADLK